MNGASNLTGARRRIRIAPQTLMKCAGSEDEDCAMKNVSVGTAGHIDHGKSALVLALTGTHADRLEEENRRGLTIDIGFATLDLGEYRPASHHDAGQERSARPKPT